MEIVLRFGRNVMIFVYSARLRSKKHWNIAILMLAR